ncbi:hypothetical protein [Paenibacillus polymyxa]|uniref:hypothetical protein n=1 Tax=Paenibacillus polymyxa TaxID=1406 RepID=UPI003216332D
MADYFHCSIEFVKGNYPKNIWEEMNLLAKVSLEMLENTYYFSGFAPNGQREELEEYLVEQGIPFDRHSEGYGEIAPELRVFRPGLIDRVMIRSNEGDAYVSTNALRSVLSIKNSVSEIVKRISDLVEEVDPSYPELAHYRIMWRKSESDEHFEPNLTLKDNDILVVAILTETV